MKTIKLNNGVEMPVLGYGVFLVNSEECERCALDAIEVGYRLIDTAQAYYNEDGVGRAIEKCGVPRNELFITTKVWISNAGEEKAFRSIGESLRKLKTDYIDLLLIHQPFGDYYGTYRAMERAYRDGMVRAIGLSNFYDALKFLTSEGIVAIPKSIHKDRMASNFNIADFELTEEDKETIRRMDTGKLKVDFNDPDMARYLLEYDKKFNPNS